MQGKCALQARALHVKRCRQLGDALHRVASHDIAWHPSPRSLHPWHPGYSIAGRSSLRPGRQKEKGQKHPALTQWRQERAYETPVMRGEMSSGKGAPTRRVTGPIKRLPWARALKQRPARDVQHGSLERCGCQPAIGDLSVPKTSRAFWKIPMSLWQRELQRSAVAPNAHVLRGRTTAKQPQRQRLCYAGPQ